MPPKLAQASGSPDRSRPKLAGAQEARVARATTQAEKSSSLVRYAYLPALLWIIALLFQRVLAGVYVSPAGQHSSLHVPRSRPLVLTAHPDDEAMFFAPTILSLTGQATAAASKGADALDQRPTSTRATSNSNDRQRAPTVFALSLSHGNATGLGAVRRLELYSSYAKLGVPSMRTAVLDDASLRDGMQTTWDADYIADLLERYVQQLGITSLITFDAEGVSGHANHKACHAAVQTLARNWKTQEELARSVQGFSEAPQRPEIWVLQSVPLPWKFAGLPKVLLEAALYRLGAVVRGEFELPSITNTALKQAQQGRSVKGGKEQSAMPTRPSSPISAGSLAAGQLGKLFILSRPVGYSTAWKAMAEHRSQLVWFRYLYVLFSTFMHANTLVRIA